MESLSERLKWCRSRFRWTQQDLANEAGVNLDTIRRMEQRHFEPRLETVRRLAETLAVREGWLAFGEDPMLDLRHMTADQQHRSQGGSEHADRPGYVIVGPGPWFEHGGEWQVDRKGESSDAG